MRNEGRRRVAGRKGFLQRVVERLLPTSDLFFRARARSDARDVAADQFFQLSQQGTLEVAGDIRAALLNQELMEFGHALAFWRELVGALHSADRH